MSGFGSGFGSQQPPPFGTPAPPPNNPSQFGSGFGSAPSSSGFNNSGFGSSNNNFGGGFNSQQQPPSNTSPFVGTGFGNAAGGNPPFGTVSNQPAFGSSSMSSGGFNTSQQTNVGFGSTPAVPTSFGQTQPTSTPAQTPFGQSQPTSTPAQTPFGQAQPNSTPAQTPFGQAQATSSTTSFGNSNTATTSFGSTSGGLGTTSTPATPFGSTAAAAAPSSAISFGVSSNIAPTPQGFGTAAAAPTTTSTPFSNAPSGFGDTSSGFGDTLSGFGNNNAPLNASPAFGVSTSTSFAPSSNAFGGPSSDYNDDNMMDGGGPTSEGTTPFGSSATASSGGTTPFGSSSATASSSQWVQSSSNNNDRVSSPQPIASSSDMQEQDSSMSPIPSSISTSTTKQQDELKAKKAAILRKKKKLEELKRRKEAAAPVPSSSSSSLNAGAPSFVPNETISAPPDAETQSLADRNAARFAKPDTGDDLLPQELRNRQGAVASGYKDDGDDEALDIDNAVSLVGTCPYMCPDDELIRRQKEGDIQLLETPQPGTIHPSDWTLRNTAVKRFRRSAADYKLNVPEWVRPPDVLETVCGYLEEWVMDRDRQGPDPRFPQSESPPPLDVYQFIWDRTRMIRKDFILQNYVGTGGNCDARAVRCHERIARWHAMCEHQLSHIPEYVTAQSQQNIQEFGQAMKTLNMFYDDSLGRSTVEVPDENGNETRTDLTGMTHGCSNEIVMGANPVDFDGTPLKNDADNVSKRLIGPQAVNSPAHGTAQPEMSGLYILMTMNNDGGMEVLKYASRLHSKRPEIYNSKPVQLALRIFKARKDHNYAKFFSLLRDPETPYLFACIMFKQVEEMRMLAIYTMSKVYGGVMKKTKQSVDDQYPLKRLVRLLCFEDASEALATCRHYNITVEESPSTNPNSPSGSNAIIYWKRSPFRRPKDPEKGFTLTLPPRKMMRTIEAKLNGATRLAVCRGEVSGDGAALSSVPTSRPSVRAADAVSQQQMAISSAVSTPAQAVETPQTDEQAAKRRLEERRRLREEQKRKEKEELQKEEAERKQREEAGRQALILRKQKEEELRREQARAEEELKKQRAEEECLRQEQLRREAEAAAKEEQLRREAEERRLAAARAEAQRKAEAERLEMLRQAELQRKREEGERLERIRREKEEKRRREEEKRRLEEERIRQEQERLRQEQLRLQREREERERRLREEEARRIAAAKEAKMNQARKLLIWRRLRSKLEGELRKERTRQSLNRLDPTFSGALPAPVFIPSSDTAGMLETNDFGIDARASLLPGISVLDSLSRQCNGPLNLSALLRKALYSLQRNAPSLAGAGDVILTQVAVVLPTFAGPKADAMRSLVHTWIGKRLEYGTVAIDLPENGQRSFEIRTVASIGNAGNADCDMALLVIPPHFGDDSLTAYSALTFPQLDGVVSRAILCLDSGSNRAYAKVVDKLLSSVLQDVPFIQVGEELRTDVFDLSLENASDALIQSFVATVATTRSESDGTRGALVRLPISQLASRCIRGALWRDGIHPGTNEEHMIMDRTRGVLVAMMAQLKSLFTSYRTGATWSNWPAREFTNVRGVVPNYFGDGVDLPADWKDSLSHAEVEPAVMKLYKELDGVSFMAMIDSRTMGAPEQVKQDCREMLAKRQFRRCFEYILLWEEANIEPEEEEEVVYLPKQSVAQVVEGCIQRMALNDDDNDFTLPDTESTDQLEAAKEADENVFAVELMQAMRSPQLLLEESTPRAVDSLAGDGSRPLAESTRTPDSNIMSPPVGVQTPATPAVGVQTPATPADGVGTPATLPPSANDILGGSKRLLDSGDALTKSPKRRRGSPLSKNLKESMAFTKKLESMLQGETVSDMKVGNVKLADLLSKAPDIEHP